jgi:ketosteroid isomerase-like protein
MKSGFLFTVAAACALALPAATSAQDSPSVQELANRWAAAYNNVDSVALAALYAEDGELYIHNEGRYIGRAAIGDYWIGDMSRSNPLTVLHVTDSVVDAEMMLVHGNYQVIDRVDGVPLGAGRFAHIWVLEEDGSWALDRDVWVDTGIR